MASGVRLTPLEIALFPARPRSTLPGITLPVKELFSRLLLVISVGEITNCPWHNFLPHLLQD